jgi:hypothetical protein
MAGPREHVAEDLLVAYDALAQVDTRRDAEADPALLSPPAALALCS